MGTLDNVLDQIRRNKIPVTMTLLGISAAVFLMDWLTGRGFPGLALSYSPTSLSLPFEIYRLFTYPFAFNSLISLLFLGLWLWNIGGIVEQELESTRYAIFWFAITGISALSHYLGYLFTGISGGLYGLWVPTAAVTVAWGTRHPNLPLSFMFILPITAKWLAWLSVLLVIFGTSPPLLALFAAAPLGLVYLYAADKVPFLSWNPPRISRSRQTRKKEVDFIKYLHSVEEKKKEREEKERLRRLFEQNFHQENDKD
jgi:membrane associated rhomboid family serine protease